MGKPLSIPWQGRIRDSGLPLPENVFPKLLLEQEVVRWRGLAHEAINRVLGYTVIDKIPHVLMVWEPRGNIRGFMPGGTFQRPSVEVCVEKVSRIDPSSQDSSHPQAPTLNSWARLQVEFPTFTGRIHQSYIQT